jgi:hypothetical protein
VFIDDSGDPGFHFERGSTRLLVVACLVFDSAEAINIVVQDIATIGLQQQRTNLNEFKFSKMRFGMAKQLLETVSKNDFRVSAVVVDKTIWKRGNPRDTSSLYPLVLANAISSVETFGNYINVKIDGKGNRRSKLRDFSLPMPKIRKLRYVDSRSDVLIQLADVIAGCIRRAHDETDHANANYLQLYRAVLEQKTSLRWLE